MIAARYTQGDTVRFEDVPVPAVGDGELLLRVDATGICGTDVKIVRHGHRKLVDGQTITLGHEFVGTIDRVGGGVSGFTEGQRVGVAPNMGRPGSEMVRRGMANMDPEFTAFGITQDGSHAEYLRVTSLALEQGNVFLVPDGVEAVDAALAEPLSCAVSSVRNAQVRSGDMVVVYGAGPMGLLNVVCATASGAERVVAFDRDDARLACARRLGATDAVNNREIDAVAWMHDQTRGRGVDVVVLAVPVPDLQQEALEALAPFGRLCNFAGWARDAAAVSLDTNPIHYKNLTVTGMTGGCNADYAKALDLIAEGKAPVRQLVSHTVPMRRMEDGYRVALGGSGMKVVLVTDDAVAPRSGGGA